MRTILFLFLTIFSTMSAAEQTSETLAKNLENPGALIFTPPEGWVSADPKILPKSVKMMVIGKGKKDYPPSINLGVEPFKGTLREYLKLIKTINESQGAVWKDLGMIETDAGKASLSQVDMRSNWGGVRLMHVILLKNGHAYILTAGALKEEFPIFYKDFFKAMTSIHFNKDLFEMVEPKRKRNRLIRAYKKLTKQTSKRLSENHGKFGNFDELSSDETYQKEAWQPFVQMVEENYQEMGEDWKSKFFEEVKIQLIAQTP